MKKSILANTLSMLSLLAPAVLNSAIASPSIVALKTTPAVKTISVKETLTYFDDSTGKAAESIFTDIDILQPDKASAVFHVPGRTARYLVNGKTEYDCQDGVNYYKLNYTPGNDPLNLRSQCYLEAILHGVPNSPPRLLADAEGMVDGRMVELKQHSHTEKAIATDTLDGHPMVLTTVSTTKTSVVTEVLDAGLMTPEMKTPVVTQTRTRYWVDADTHRVSRVLNETLKGSEWTPTSQVDFSDWKIDGSIPDSLFVWSPDPKMVWANKPADGSPSSGPRMSAPLVKGAQAPEFSAMAPDGKLVHLSDYKGKIVVLDFWATWCGSCQAAMPHLEKVYQQVKNNKDVAVLGLCVSDQQPKFDLWVKNRIGVKYHFPVAFDTQAASKNSIGAMYHLAFIPSQYILDKDGKIASINIGGSGGEDFLEKNLQKLGVSIPVPTQH